MITSKKQKKGAYRCLIALRVICQRREVPKADDWSLHSLSFDDFSLLADEMVLAALRMFLDLGLVSRFKIDYPVSKSWKEKDGRNKGVRCFVLLYRLRLNSMKMPSLFTSS
jgi:hypothetical protein